MGWKYTGGDIVPLGRWSDLVFLEYENLCKTADTRDGGPFDVKGLKAVFRSRIVNADTKNIIFEIAEKKGFDGPPAWPGMEFKMDTDEGKALLGTPNGNGVGWLLFSHREQLGWKTVKVCSDRSIFTSAELIKR